MRILLGLLCLLLCTAATAQVPHTFQSGQTALAAEVNENFVDLDTRVATNTTSIDQSIGTLVLTQASASDGDGVVSISCPVDSLVGSANCNCDSEAGSRNFGVLFSCEIAGNGGIAGCFDESGTFNPNLPPPLATVTLVCVSGIQNDGTPITPVSFKGAASAISKIDESGSDLDIAVNRARSTVAEHRSTLQNR